MSAATDDELPDTHDSRLSGKSAILLAFLMAVGASFVLCGYELIRTTANTLFVTTYGKKWLPLGLGLVPIGAGLFVYIYGRLLSWLGPRRTLAVTTLLASLTMLVCYVGIRAGIKPLRGVLFVFKESYVVLLIEQYWSYINSMLSKRWARLLNGPICAVASVGAAFGPYLLSPLSQSWGTLSILLLAAGTTLPAMLFGDAAYRRFGEPADKPKLAAGTGTPKSSHGYLRLDLFKKQRILLLILGLVVSAQVVAATQEIWFKSLLQDHYPNPDAQNAFSLRFYGWLNGGALILQLIAAPLFLRYVPYTVIQLLIPLVHLGTLAYALLDPTSLYRAEVSYFLFKALDYSLFRSAKELLYVPLSFDVRHRAKEIIDVFGYRFSKGVTSLSITLLQQFGVIFANQTFAVIGFGGAVAWLLLVVPIARYAKDPTKSSPSQPGS